MADTSSEPPPPRKSELAARTVSGLLLAAAVFAMAYLGPAPFAVLLFVIAAIMSWEWGHIVRQEQASAVLAVHVLSVLGASVLTFNGSALLAAGVLILGASVAGLMAFGASHARLSAIGVLYTGLPAIALGWLRSDPSLGFLAVLLVALTVIATDTAAYFSGRTIGGPKLWPQVSPNKTWSGLAGGVTAAALTGVLFPVVSGSGSSTWLGILGLFLGLVSQAGDLAESALKRRFSVKDASILIPGHGGFMDRMDGLVFASVLAGIIAFAIDAHLPGRALLYGS